MRIYADFKLRLIWKRFGKMTEAYIGVDVGSVSTNIAVIDSWNHVLASSYIRTHGRPIEAVEKGLREIAGEIDNSIRIAAAGTTGSGRYLTGILVGADVVKNEITAHAVAAVQEIPDVQTIFEIGGQDSKFVLLRPGVVTDFAMNTVCAAGTGSFLDQQAARLAIPIEQFGDYALRADSPVRIAGRCTVFAESDMIHKQQMGHSSENIIAGLCEAMVRNYLNNVVKGKDTVSPIIFQGGVAANVVADPAIFAPLASANNTTRFKIDAAAPVGDGEDDAVEEIVAQRPAPLGPLEQPCLDQEIVAALHRHDGTAGALPDTQIGGALSGE